MNLLLGDCLEKLKELEDNSVDAIVTDPPYGLSFMGKKWDYDVPKVDIWKECLRVLKPGGYLLAFAGTRTQHRMAVNIEDAGFEIRDMIAWVYGSGFPKSLNIGKQIDKQDTEDFRRLVGIIIKRARTKKGMSMDELCNLLGLNNTGHGGMVNHYENGRATPTLELWKKICNVLDIEDLQDYEETKKGRTKTVGKIENPISWFGSGFEKIATTEEAKEWEGWGTALKPALEPITVARKPLSEKTVAENCLKWGVGGINIDGCRVEYKDGTTPEQIMRKYTGSNIGKDSPTNAFGVKDIKCTNPEGTISGRFPANLIHDGSDEVVELFPQTKSGGMNSIAKGSQYNTYGKMYERRVVNQASEGSASRFFYCAKASKKERNIGCEGLETSEKFTAGNYSQSPTCKDCNLTLNGTNDHSKCSGEVYYKEMESKNTKNNHPTVKPLALMEYLVKLVSKEGATVLDPFMGSGTTGMACKKLNREFIGIEMMPEYMEIAKARIEAVKQEEQLNIL